MMRSAILSAAILGLAACASSGPRELPQATAVQERVRVEMPVDPRDNGLTWAQLDLVAALADEYKAVGHGPFVISYPAEAGNSEAAIAAIADVRTRLYEHGLDWREIGGGAYHARGRASAPVIFSFERYVAVAPDCPQVWPDMTESSPGEAWPQFGCATASNLAAMVADPRDLVAPRGMGDPDSGRRQAIIDAWRSGQPTATRRSAEESGTVSEVVE